MLDQIRALSDSLFPTVVKLRRTLHANPELAFEEYETARLVHDTLVPLGVELRTGIAKTGVVATLRGAMAGPSILLRADMDALPIHEETGLEFASRIPGKMHACGHDVHTSSLLGAAMILSRLREKIAGTIHFVFQPSEERLPGGAKVMIEEGLLGGEILNPPPARIYGQHVQPDLPAGKLGIRSGMYMASADEIYVTVRGEGGHAAMPHRLQSDAVVTASHIVVALQTVISRNCPPDSPSILTIGKVAAEGATNVIPAQARLEGTFRAMDEEWRFKAHALIRRVIEHTARAHGAEAEIDIVVGYPALYNDPEEAAVVRSAAVRYAGEENVVDLDKWFASEDFAWYLKELPGAFYRLGTASTSGAPVHGLHTSRLMINEEALRTGPGFMAYLAMESLHRNG